MSREEIARFVVWCAASLVVTILGTVAMIRKALRMPPHTTFSSHYLVVWLSTWAGSLVVLSLLAGAVVFRRTAPWSVVLTWPWMIGLVVGFGSYMALTPHTEDPRFCQQQGGSCDTAWGMGAMLLAIVAAIALGGAFVTMASLRRFVDWLAVRLARQTE